MNDLPEPSGNSGQSFSESDPRPDARELLPAPSEASNVPVSPADNRFAAIFDAVLAYCGDVPVALKKNLGKVLEHMVKLPAAWIDGKAAEIRAVSEARALLTRTTGERIAEKIDVDASLAAIAAATSASKILRQQVNGAAVVGQAVQDLRTQPPPDAVETIPDLSDDWLNAFEREAVEMSSEHMQRLFGKILAGEMRRPRSYSIRTVKLMAQLDNRPAELFRRLCSCACTLRLGHQIFDARVPSLGKSAASNSLSRYGLSFDDLNVLFEYGLIISDYNSFLPYAPVIAAQGVIQLSLEHQGEHFCLMPKETWSEEKRKGFKVNGVSLSQAGKELLDIVDIEPVPDYTTTLREYFAANGLVLVPARPGSQ